MSKSKKGKFKYSAPLVNETLSAEGVAALSAAPEVSVSQKSVFVLRLTPKLVLVLLTVVGVLVHWSGLATPFQRDDLDQVQNNSLVHSLANLPQFFSGSTFAGPNAHTFAGAYYRPLMTTMFSLVYTFFGDHTWAYHVLQLAVFIAGVFLLYLILTRYISSVVALFLSLIFLVHPLNSMAVYYIACLQDVLFLAFGLLALWLLQNSRSTRNMWLASISLLLCMFSKESAVSFLLLSAIFLWIYRRDRLLKFLVTLSPFVVLYLILKIHAVGIVSPHHSDPITYTSFSERLFTMPAIIQFYLTKFVYPMKFSLAYYWEYTRFSWAHVFVPLVIDLGVIAVAAAVGRHLKRSASLSQFRAYVFFSTWAVVTLIPYMQIVPLDMTVSDTWFLASMAGLLGMIGVVLNAYPRNAKWMPVVATLVIVLLGARTYYRGFDYSVSLYSIDVSDISASRENFQAYAELSTYYSEQQQFKKAEPLARKSLDLFPGNENGYRSLATALTGLGDFKGATEALQSAYSRWPDPRIAENLALLTLVYGDQKTNQKFLEQSVSKFPEDLQLRLDLARFYQLHFEGPQARATIVKASQIGSVPPDEYFDITRNISYPVNLSNTGYSVTIPSSPD